jgi:hypothetical protein
VSWTLALEANPQPNGVGLHGTNSFTMHLKGSSQAGLLIYLGHANYTTDAFFLMIVKEIH